MTESTTTFETSVLQYTPEHWLDVPHVSAMKFSVTACDQVSIYLSDSQVRKVLPQYKHIEADDIFKCIFLNENVWNPIKISLKFVPKGPINNNPSLVQIMVWRRPSTKPLSEPIMGSLLTHLRVTRPQWVQTVFRGIKICLVKIRRSRDHLILMAKMYTSATFHQYWDDPVVDIFKTVFSGVFP